MTEDQLKQLSALAAVLNAQTVKSHNFGEGKGLAAWFDFETDEEADVFIEQANSLNMGLDIETSQFVGLVFVNWN